MLDMSNETKMSVCRRAVSETQLSPPECKKAAIYCRTATQSDFSIRGQEERLRLYAEMNGFGIVSCYADDGESGVTLNRPAFQKMMTDIESGEVNCVIFADFSRLSRNHIQLGEWLNEMCTRNIRTISVSDCYDSSKNRFALNVFFAEVIERLCREEHSKKIKAGIARKRGKEGAKQTESNG